MHTFSYNFFYFTFKTESRKTQIEINIIQEKIQMEEIELEKNIYNIYICIFIYLFILGGGVDFTGHSYMHLLGVNKIQNSFF